MKKVLKEIKAMWSLWKTSVNWDGQSKNQKLLMMWFGTSFALLFITAESWFIVPAIANFALSAKYTTKYVNIPDE